MRSLGIVTVALLCAAGCSRPPAGFEPEPTEPESLPERTRIGPGTRVAGIGVVDPAGQLVFLPAKAGGIEALEITSGRVVWTNKQGGTLVDAYDSWVIGRLTEWGHILRITVIDAPTGRIVTTSEQISLPGWAMLDREDRGCLFHSTAWAAGGHINFAWSADTWYTPGDGPEPPPPTKEQEDAARHHASGLVRIDPATGKVTVTQWQPTDADFRAWSQTLNGVNVAGFEFVVTVSSVLPTGPGFRRRFVNAVKDGRTVWQREVAGVPYHPQRM